MHPLLYYIIFSYPIIGGALWEAAAKDDVPKLFVFLFSPLSLPVYIGMWLSKHYND